MASPALCWDSDAETVVDDDCDGGSRPEAAILPSPSTCTGVSAASAKKVYGVSEADECAPDRVTECSEFAAAVSPMTSVNILSQCAAFFDGSSVKRGKVGRATDSTGEGVAKLEVKAVAEATRVPAPTMGAQAQDPGPPARSRKRSRALLPISDDLCRVLLKRLEGKRVCAFEVTDAFDVDDLRKLARRRPTADGGRLPKGKRGLVELVVELCRSGGPLSRFLPAEHPLICALSCIAHRRPGSGVSEPESSGDGDWYADAEDRGPALREADAAALAPTPCIGGRAGWSASQHLPGSREPGAVILMRDAACQTDAPRGCACGGAQPAQAVDRSRAGRQSAGGSKAGSPLRSFSYCKLLDNRGLYRFGGSVPKVPYGRLARQLIPGSQVHVFRRGLQRFASHYSALLGQLDAVGYPVTRDLPGPHALLIVDAIAQLVPPASASDMPRDPFVDTAVLRSARVLTAHEYDTGNSLSLLWIPRLLSDTPEYIVPDSAVREGLELEVSPGDWVSVPFAPSRVPDPPETMIADVAVGMVVEIGHGDASLDPFASVHLMWLEPASGRSSEWVLVDPVAQMDNAVSPWDVLSIVRRCRPEQCLPFPWLASAPAAGQPPSGRRAWRLAALARAAASSGKERLLSARGCSASDVSLQVAGMAPTGAKTSATVRQRIAWAKALDRVCVERAADMDILPEAQCVEMVLRLLDWHPVVSLLFDSPPDEEDMPGYAERLGHMPRCLDGVVHDHLCGRLQRLDDLERALCSIWDDAQAALPPLSFLHAMAEASRVAATKMLRIARRSAGLADVSK